MEKRRKRNKKKTKNLQRRVKNFRKKIVKRKNTLSKKKKKKKTKEKVTVRAKEKYPGLNRRFFSKAKQIQHDIDYVNKIDDPKVLQWLNNFMEEWVGARLNHPGKKFHKTKKARKQIWDANNARNRDMMSIYTRFGSESDDYVFDLLEKIETQSPEDCFIEMIDYKKKCN